MSFYCDWCHRLYHGDPWYTKTVPGSFCSETCCDYAVEREQRNSSPKVVEKIVYKDNSEEIDQLRSQLEEAQNQLKSIKQEEEKARHDYLSNISTNCDECGRGFVSGYKDDLFMDRYRHQFNFQNFCSYNCIIKYYERMLYENGPDVKLGLPDEKRLFMTLKPIFEEKKKIEKKLAENPIPYITWHKFYRKAYTLIKAEIHYLNSITVPEQTYDGTEEEIRTEIRLALAKQIKKETDQKKLPVDKLNYLDSREPTFYELSTKYSPVVSMNNILLENKQYKRLYNTGKISSIQIFTANEDKDHRCPYLYLGFYDGIYNNKDLIFDDRAFDDYWSDSQCDKSAQNFNEAFSHFQGKYGSGFSQDFSSQHFLAENLQASWNLNLRKIVFKVPKLINIAYRPTGALKLALYFSKENNAQSVFKSTCLGEVLLPIEHKLLYPSEGWENKVFEASFSGKLPESGDYYPVITIVEHYQGKWYFTTGENCMTFLNKVHFGNNNVAQPVTPAVTTTTAPAASGVSKYRKMMDAKKDNTDSKPAVSKYRQMVKDKTESKTQTDTNAKPEAETKPKTTAKAKADAKPKATTKAKADTKPKTTTKTSKTKKEI